MAVEVLRDAVRMTMSGLLQRLAFVTGVVPAEPRADVQGSALLASEIVLGMSAIVAVAAWYVHVAVSLVWWLVAGARRPWKRHLECLVEWQTFVLMRLFGRQYPRPQLDAPLADQWPRVRGWHLLSGPEVEAGASEWDPATAVGRAQRTQVRGKPLSFVGVIGLFCLIAGAAAGNGGLALVGLVVLVVTSAVAGVAAASRLLHW